ncbi:MAG: UDP-N-acetylmuramate dehydrogenase [Pseudomonadota bacterium]
MALRGQLLYNESMAKHTSWRVGGPADCFYVPADLADLVGFIRQLPPDEPVFWLGLGSNLLVRDGGIRGTVILTHSVLNQFEQLSDTDWRVEAGVHCARIARATVLAGLQGGQFMIGIPGTLGGALAMNAGAFGGETWTIVHQVETLSRSGQQKVRPASDYQSGYRHLQAPDDSWFTAAILRFEAGGDVAAGQAAMKQLLQQRRATQPVGQPSCGSVFTNPSNDHAARLIDSAGLKGVWQGGAQVSEKHANFIINQGEATAADIEALIARVQTEVLRVHNIQLIPEVRVVGEAVWK